MKLHEITNPRRPRRRTYHFRIRYGANTFTTGIWADDRYRAEYLLFRRYPGAVIIGVS